MVPLARGRGARYRPTVKLLQIVQRPQRRGAEIFASQFAAELRRRGHEVRTAYLEACDQPGALTLTRDDIVLAETRSMLWERATLLHPLRVRRLSRLLDAFDPDVVQVGGGRTLKYGAALHILRRRPRWALVLRSIGKAGDWVRGAARKGLYKRILMPRVDGVISVTQDTTREFREIYEPNVPVVTIPTGVDARALAPTRHREEVRRELDTPDAVPVVLFVGSLTPEKRPDRFLRTVARLRASIPSLHAWVAGDGPLADELQSQAHELGLSEHVRLLGVRADIGDLMQAADLLLMTSDSEGIPRVILEAGLMRRPVVAPRIGGIWEFLVAGETGLLFPPGDEVAAATAVESLLGDRSLCHRMGDHAHERVSGTLTMTAIADRYLAFYQDLLSHRSP